MTARRNTRARLGKAKSNFAELGVSGLTQYSGIVHEEWQRRLQGTRGRRAYREMADNDSLIGAILFAVEMLLRGVTWRVEPFDDSPDAVEEAEFVESLTTDMSHTWGDFVAEALSMLVYGFSAHEIVYKRREGPLQRDPSRRSRFNDGRIGWRKLPLRAQDTVSRWDFTEDGGIKGLWQQPPLGGAEVYVPIEKLLLFRTTSRKNSPEGRSILRNAFVDYYHKARIADYEAIGVERDLAGLPLLYVPPEMLDPNTDAGTKANFEELKKIAQNVRNDEQACVILPSIFDETGTNRLLEFTLMGTGSRRLFDTSAIIQRRERAMAMTVLADFILLGHEKVGSFALSSDKTALFATALGAWLSALADPVNRYGLPRLYELNGMDPSRVARLVPNDVEKPDVERFAASVSQLTAAGFLTPGSEADEERVRDMLDLPEVATAEREALRAAAAPEPAPPEDEEDDGGEDDTP